MATPDVHQTTSPGDTGSVEAELSALRVRLEEIDRATDGLVVQDVEEVLSGIVERMSREVGDLPCLLVAEGPVGPAAHVEVSGGLDPVQARELAEQLVAGQEPGRLLVSEPIASERRAYGFLAVVLDVPTARGGDRDTVDRSVLETAAREAAAALDLVATLRSHGDAGRVEALLDLLSWVRFAHLERSRLADLG